MFPESAFPLIAIPSPLAGRPEVEKGDVFPKRPKSSLSSGPDPDEQLTRNNAARATTMRRMNIKAFLQKKYFTTGTLKFSQTSPYFSHLMNHPRKIYSPLKYL